MSKNKSKKRNIVENGLASATGVDLSSGYNNTILSNIGEMVLNASPVILSNLYQTLSNTYKSNSFAKIAVDLPVQDAFRDGGFSIDSQTLDADQLLELENCIEDNNDKGVLIDCVRWGRLYGGGVILANTNQNPDTPFNPETIYNKDVEFIACDRWQCYPQSSSLYLADKFTLQDLNINQTIATYDKSRLKVFTGETQPYYIRNQLQGWGASIFEAILPALSQYIKANNVILELLDEAKIDILKIDGLSDLLSSADGESAVKQRLKIFAQEKNFQSVGAMDAADDYIQKQITFSTLDQMIEKIMLLICSALRIPYSKVFGKGASGFSSGEDDLENYNAMVMSCIRKPLTPIIRWIVDVRCCQLFGNKVDDIVINWKPLRVLSEVEQQNVKNQKVQNYIQLAQLGVMTKKQVAEQLTQDKIVLFKPEEIDAIDDDIDMDEIKDIDVNVKNSADKKPFFKLWN